MRIATTVRLLTLPTLAALGIAQAPPMTDAAWNQSLGWTSHYGTPGAFTRTAACDLDASGSPDLIVLEGGFPTVLWDAPFHSHFQRCPFPANDIATAAGASPIGTDALVIVNADGVSLVSITSPTDPTFLQTTVLQDEWKFATRVACRVSAGGDLQYAAIHASGVELLSYRHGVTTILPSPGGETFVALGLVQWDADSELEVAGLTTNGVVVFEPQGAPSPVVLAAFSHGVSNSMAVVPKHASDPTDVDRIAVAHTLSTADRRLTIYSPQGGAPTEVLLGGTTCRTLVAGDIDGDGDADLIGSNTRYLAPRCFRNHFGEAGVPLFRGPQTANGETWQDFYIDDHPALMTAYAGNNLATPAVYDFTQDGIADIALAAPQTTATAGENPAVIALETVDETPPAPPAGGAPPCGSTPEYVNLLIGGAIKYQDPSPTPTTQVWLRVPRAGIEAAANAVRITVYRQLETAGVYSDLDPAAVVDYCAPIHAIPACSLIGLPIELPLQTPCFGGAGGANETYWVALRPMQYSTAGGVPTLPLIRGYRIRYALLSSQQPTLCTYLATSGDELESQVLLDHAPNQTAWDPAEQYVVANPPPAAATWRCGSFSCSSSLTAHGPASFDEVAHGSSGPGAPHFAAATPTPGVANRRSLPPFPPAGPPTLSLVPSPTNYVAQIYDN